MSKPMGIYLGSRDKILNAFSSETRKKLSDFLNIGDVFYDEDFFKKCSDDFSQIQDAEYAFSTWGIPKLNKDEIKKYLPKLKAVFYAAGSVKEFAEPFMDCGVDIFSAWGANAVPVAEYTVSQILLANKGFFQTLHRGGGAWTERKFSHNHPGNFDTNVGIIGAGMIGKMVIEALKKHRLKVMVFDPFLSYENAGLLGAEKIEKLPLLFEKCHVISNHLANNPQTVGMIDKSCFEKMDSNGVFINTGRGQQVVEKDLVEMLKKCPQRCAVLDVTYPEPPEENSELYILPNVFLTPHIAGSIGNEVKRMGEYMLEEFTDYYEGRKTKYLVSREMLATMA